MTNTPENKVELTDLLSDALSDDAETVDIAGTAKVFVNSAETAGEVADVLGESGQFSEGEDQSKGKQTKAKTQGASVASPIVHSAPPMDELPLPKVMGKEVRRELEKEIEIERKDVMKVMMGTKKVDPTTFAQMVKRLRQLVHMLASLLDISFEGLKKLYALFVRKEKD